MNEKVPPRWQCAHVNIEPNSYAHTLVRNSLVPGAKANNISHRVRRWDAHHISLASQNARVWSNRCHRSVDSTGTCHRCTSRCHYNRQGMSATNNLHHQSQDCTSIRHRGMYLGLSSFAHTVGVSNLCPPTRQRIRNCHGHMPHGQNNLLDTTARNNRVQTNPLRIGRRA